MDLRQILMNAYWHVECRLAPGLQYSQAHYEQALAGVVKPGCAWLDIGCGHQLLPSWRKDGERALIDRSGSVVGVDLDHPSLVRHQTIRARARADLAALPFPAATFDLATANMVVEHLEHPEQQFTEIARVLKPGGVFLLHTPNARAYTAALAKMIPPRGRTLLARLLEGRTSADVFPTHYRANTEGSIRRIAAMGGFDGVTVAGVTSTAELAMVLPLAVIELLWIRALMNPRREHLRHTLIAVLRKPE